ncbi:MAG: hypothetical protein B9S32_13780 [Verrucomicrobia bacterium Tous-C9LFEB]|nr:MAG: hypothetical protein B9S32_13780 [Verrucomicrobia bacterium Tous-C9LFEB]
MPRAELKHEQLDLTILDRVSEADVQHWLLATLHLLRNELSQLTTLDLNVSRYEGCDSYRFGVGAHGGGKCSVGERDVAAAISELRVELYNRPDEKAREKREAAARLLREAAELELLAATAT